MKTKTIFKTLALAMMMPAMLLTTACSSDDDAVNNGIKNNENTAGKGYALPVTINVSRQGEGTRATYNEGTKTLSFSSGDQLFVTGTDGTAGAFAGTLTWTSGGTFSGTIYTANSYSGTAEALLTSASTAATATLLPAGYGSIGYLSVIGDGYSATLATDATKAFATSKADGVAQLSLEQASTYDDGFELAPQNAILNFTVTGLTAGTPTAVSLTAGSTTISGSVTPVEVDYSGTATFAMAVAHSATASSLTLTVDGTAVSLGSHTLTAGKIYNQKLRNINGAGTMIPAGEKWLVYGTGDPSGWQLSVAEGATVTLHNVNLSDASIVCMGSNTIILADGTTNSVTDAGHLGGPAIIYMGDAETTLTIKGTGTLNVTGGYDNPAIGPMGGSCGNITIENTVHLTATKGDGYNVTKAITTGTGGGTVTIGGVPYADGANSPFVYPIPACSYTAPTLVSGTLTYNGSAQALVTGGSATNATIHYSTDGGSNWSTSVPTGTNAGNYTVYYKVVPDDGYTGGVESTSLGTKTINKANGWVTLSPNSSSGWKMQGSTTSASASISHHGGALSYSKGGAESYRIGYLNVSISGNTLYLSRNDNWDSCTDNYVIVTSAATNNYNAASARYTCNY